MDKKRVTLYVDSKLLELARLEVDNLSELVNNLLSMYLSASSTDEIDKKISDHEHAINILKEKKKELLKLGVHESKRNSMYDTIVDNFRKSYVKRREQLGDNFNVDLSWLSSPSNLSRCRLVGKDPLVLLRELREWYENEYVKRECERVDDEGVV